MHSLFRRKPFFRFSVIVNYLIWRVTFSCADLLNEEMRDRNLKFMKVLSGIETLEARWKECVEVVSSNLPIAASSLYVQKYFNKESKKAALEIVNAIREEFLNILHGVSWMDDKTRAAALEKAKKMEALIGYPDELLNNSKLRKYFGNITIDQDKYFESMIRINKFNTAKMFEKLREPVNKTDWENHAEVAIINAFYNPLENNIREGLQNVEREMLCL